MTRQLLALFQNLVLVGIVVGGFELPYWWAALT